MMETHHKWRRLMFNPRQMLQSRGTINHGLTLIDFVVDVYDLLNTFGSHNPAPWRSKYVLWDVYNKVNGPCHCNRIDSNTIHCMYELWISKQEDPLCRPPMYELTQIGKYDLSMCTLQTKHRPNDVVYDVLLHSEQWVIQYNRVYPTNVSPVLSGKML